MLKHASWAIPVFLVVQFLFFPWFEQYKYGFKAKIQPILGLTILLFLLGLGGRGIFWANDIIDDTHNSNLINSNLACPKDKI
ncbi:hypothetical protein [Marinicellulosiphila megalodicopiae]|uniref:hypothetical protein n=1 Tax=Marinicellulosiphila megalodicopiae TaxID=2724896 RepID=UPI003BB18D54